MVSIKTLGTLSIQIGRKQLITGLSDKAIAIICLLLSSEGQKLGKNKIIHYFWGDSDEMAARSNLRYNLWSIKKIITTDENGEDFILSDKTTLFINQRYDFWCDIVQLKGFNKSKSWTMDELNAFRELFKGEYLEGFYIKGCVEYSDTILFERISCQRLQISILELLYAGYLEEGDYDNCNSVLNELLYIDPFQEKYVQQLMDNYVKQQQSAKAVAYYKNFDNNLRRNLNISPSKELKAFYQRIYAKAPIPEKCQKHVALRTFCIESVEYFWMSECIYQIIQLMDNGFIDSLDKNCLRDLSVIQSRLLEKSGIELVDAIPAVRILFSFYQFLTRCAEVTPLEIIIEDFSRIDNASRAFFSYTEKKPIKNLTLTIKD